MISQGMPRSQTMVAHAYNPNYSGGRDQEDCSSKSAKANSLRDPISKKKKGWQSGSRCRPCIKKKKYYKKKKKENAKKQNHTLF
jgi:hypothetical protein